MTEDMSEAMEIDGNHSRRSNGEGRSRRSFQERKICFRNLLNKIDNIEEKKDLGLETIEEVGNILREINELEQEIPIEKRVEQADETLLDCIILSSSSNILVKCINSVDISSTSYEPTDFCNKITDSLKGEDEEYRPLDLLKLLDEARTLIPEIKPFNFVFGSYDMNKLPEPKKKKIVNKHPVQNVAKKEPEKIVTQNKEEEGIEEVVKELSNILSEEYTKNGLRPINYYDYVIDTSSFTNTVNNIFHCSFLIRDGKAKLDLDDKTPTIKPIPKKELKKYRDEEGHNFQIVTTIGMEDWERFKKEGFIQKHQNRAKKRKL